MLIIGNRHRRLIYLFEQTSKNCITKVGDLILCLDEETQMTRYLFMYCDWYVESHKLDLEFGYEFEYHEIGELINVSYTVEKLRRSLRKLLKIRMNDAVERKLSKYVKEIYYPDKPHRKLDYWDDGFTEDDLIWKNDPVWIEEHFEK